MIHTEYTIVATDSGVDSRSAADACNRELMAAGDTASRDAAEAKILECRPSLRDALRIEAEEFEVWEAWKDEKRDDAERFLVPVGGTFDVAEAGAQALGVEVSEILNVARV